MSGLFTIPIGGMKEGHHSFNFEINKEFFDQFEESEIKEGSLTAVVEANKLTTHIDLSVRIEGSVNVSCDRCLELFRQPLSCENRLLVKFGHVSDDSDPDIITLPADENEFDLRQYFYEYIFLALPIQRVHPVDEDGKSACDPEMLKKLKEHIAVEEIINDPRWDELKKLMKNN
jgi:Predicted metal-binding, possibly nucleic acid-binding protein